MPAIVPGQRFTPDIVEFLQTGIAAGMYVEGASDPSLAKIRVVDT